MTSLVIVLTATPKDWEKCRNKVELQRAKAPTAEDTVMRHMDDLEKSLDALAEDLHAAKSELCELVGHTPAKMYLRKSGTFDWLFR